MTQQFDDSIPATFDDVAEFTPAFPNGNYILTIVRMENTEGQYGPGLKWVMTVVNATTGEQIMTPNGGALTASGRPEAYEWFQFSSKTLTPRSKPYPWVRAFLNRPIVVGESGAKIIRELQGKSAAAYIAPDPREIGGRQKILSIEPLAQAASAPKYAATGEPLPPSAPSSTPAVPADLMAELEELRKLKAAQNQATVAAAIGGVSEESYKALFGDQVPA